MCNHFLKRLRLFRLCYPHPRINKVIIVSCRKDVVFRCAIHAIPKNATTAQYHQATALECLLGWLYLNGRLSRVQELFETLWQSFDPNEK